LKEKAKRAPAGNLPAAPNRFIGRTEAVTQLCDLFGTSRLITLTGGPGMGKTRLALEVASRISDRFGDGVWFVDLARVKTEETLPGAVARALEIAAPGPKGRESIAGIIADRLRDQELLIVLDNCEHLAAGCAELVHDLLAASGGLKILATSQEPLAVAAEVIWRVPPLSLPVSDEVGSGKVTPEVAPAGDGQSEAAALFVERAQAVRPDFSLTPEVAPVVAEICRRLDGMPLAIELAASRLGVFSPFEIAGQLNDRLGLLVKGNRGAPVRHRTLRAAFDWSHELLGEPEAALFRRLAVFEDGFSLEAASQVCEGGSVKKDRVSELVSTLISRSLVIAETLGHQSRHRLLETTREYAQDKLVAAGELTRTRRRHAAWFAAFAETAEPNLLGGSGQSRSLDRLESERGNFRLALDWLIARRELALAARMTGPLSFFWRTRGYFAEGLESLEAVISAGGPESPEVRAKVLTAAALLGCHLDRLEEAGPKALEAVAVARDLGHEGVLANALNAYGVVSMHTMGAAKALEPFQEATVLARRAADAACLAEALMGSGGALQLLGDINGARACFNESLLVATSAGDRRGQARALEGIGWLLGDLGQAEAFFVKALDMAEEVEARPLMASVLGALATVAMQKGEIEKARPLLQRSWDLARSTGSAFALTGALSHLGQLAQISKDPKGAKELFAEAVSLARGAGLARVLAIALNGLARACAALGEVTQARSHFDEALSKARPLGNKILLASVLHSLGNLDRDQGRVQAAADSYYEELFLTYEVGSTANIPPCLEALAGLAAVQGREKMAARLFGAAEGIQSSLGARVRPPDEVLRYDSDLAEARKSLGKDDFEAAWAEGAAMPTRQAVSYASKGRGARRRPASGAESLTPAERDVSRLVAEGLTNRQVGERLFISYRTVQTHLVRVFQKLGVSSRAELAAKVAAWPP